MSDHTTALLRALGRCFPDHRLTAESIRSRDWASAAFAGVCHEIAFRIEGEGASAAADAFAEGLGDREVPMRRHILVEIALVARTDDAGGGVSMGVEALTIENA